jgi:hypothetical protein
VINIKKGTPGPGSYGQGPIQINKLGVYSISTIKNSKAANWSPSKQRFIDHNSHKKDYPAPGHYNPTDYSQGSYLLSTFKNGGSVKIIKDL